MAEIRTARERREELMKTRLPVQIDVLNWLEAFELRAFSEQNFAELQNIRKIQAGLRARTADRLRIDHGF